MEPIITVLAYQRRRLQHMQAMTQFPANRKLAPARGHIQTWKSGACGCFCRRRCELM